MRPLTLRSILVATDLSDAALPAIRTAAELARLTDARLHAVHVAEPGSAEPESALRHHLHAAGGEESGASTRIREGRPDVRIVEEARRVAADVIVLGPHRPDRNEGLGGTAYEVVRGAEVPCLIVQAPFRMPLARILVPLDVSDASRGALAVALTWASALRRRRPEGSGDATHLVALHVAAPGPDTAQPGVPVVEQVVGEVRDRFAHVAGLEIDAVLECAPDPAAAIEQRAEAGGFDLIVIGTRAQPLTGGAHLGSVSSEVVRRAAVPVLLVPPAIWRQEAREFLR